MTIQGQPDGEISFAQLVARQRPQALPAGTLLVHPPAAAWSGRVLVRLGDGGLAFVPAADLDPG